MSNNKRLVSRFDLLLYSLLRRLGVADRSFLFCGSVSRIAEASASLPVRHIIRELSQEDISALGNCNHDFESDAFRSLDSTRFRCFTLAQEKRITAYAWVGLGNIPASHNSNGHEWTGLPIYLDAETAYLFAAFVAPANRGQRLYQILLSQIASRLRDEGIKRIALTTDLKNSSAIKAVQRMGFVLYGETKFTAVAGWRRANYSVATNFLPSRLGKYVGDH
jgi:GNAT superfamily N-acetyltransferase